MIKVTHNAEATETTVNWTVKADTDEQVTNALLNLPNDKGDIEIVTANTNLISRFKAINKGTIVES